MYIDNASGLRALLSRQVIPHVILAHTFNSPYRDIMFCFFCSRHFNLARLNHNCFQIKLNSYYTRNHQAVDYITFYSSMSELPHETNVALTRKQIKKLSAKLSDAPPAEQGEHTIHQEAQPTNFIIQTNKILKKRKPLPLALLLSPNYSCGCSLKSLDVQQKNDQPYEVIRLNRFPTSIFQINETTEKSRCFLLISNFLGTKYNLYEDDQICLTISFVAGCCGISPSRKFSIFSLASDISYSNLTKTSDSQDLQQLFCLPENEGKIKKFTTLQPKRNIENGDLQLNFAKKYVLPAVQNAIVVDPMGQQAMEIVKLGENAFQVSFQQDIPKHWGLAVGIASLDFKWAIQ